MPDIQQWLVACLQSLAIIPLHDPLFTYSASPPFCVQKMLWCIWQYVYTSFLRYWLKWLVRQVTGTCELQRICSGYQAGATRTSKAGWSRCTTCHFCFILHLLYQQYWLKTCHLCPLAEYSLQSSKSKARKILLPVQKEFCIFSTFFFQMALLECESVR